MNGPDRRLDLRLLGPSLAAWGVLAVAIGMPSSIRIGILLLAAVGLAVGLRGFLPRVFWLGLALVVGLMVSLVGQDAIRSAGPLPGWAAEGAVVTAEVVLTADAEAALYNEPDGTRILWDFGGSGRKYFA